MNRQDIVRIIKKEKLVFVIRLKHQEDIPKVIKCLVRAGVKILEFTSNSSGFEKEISKVRKFYPEVLIGASTLINLGVATISCKSGTQFLVIPNTNSSVVEAARKTNISGLMGALTPIEVCDEAKFEADFIKLFPADIIGGDYFKSISEPLSNVKMLAVGGIELNDIEKWFNTGSRGIGIAGALIKSVSREEELIEIKNRATQFIEKVKAYG